MKKDDRPLESKLERKFKGCVESNKDEYVKLTVRGWPDRLIVLDGGKCLFLEFKRFGEDARLLQKHIHKKLKRKGHVVFTVDTYEEAVRIYDKVRSS